MTALQILKKVRSEMRPNAKIGEYELPVILKAMHEFAALRQPPVIKSVCGDCLYYLTCNHESRDKQICNNYDNEP